MRWNNPQNGETRIKKTFAWFPQQVGTQTLWLETIWKVEIYKLGSWYEYQSFFNEQDAKNFSKELKIGIQYVDDLLATKRRSIEELKAKHPQINKPS